MEVAALYSSNQVYLRNQFQENRHLLKELLSVAFLASQKKSIDPMEKAIAAAYGEMVSQDEDVFSLEKEYPLSAELFAMTRVVKNTQDATFSVCCKGAPEAVFGFCKLNEQTIAPYLTTVHQLAEKGFRVIAVAKVKVPPVSLPELQSDFDFEFLGLIGLEDPIRPEVTQAVKECKEAGIKVVMITGDFPATAKSIAQQIGMDTKGEILTGDELKGMSDEELRSRIGAVNVFARVVPEQKLRIVEALKANKEVVAMTGDGVNDAPALKAAHIGVAMGGKGTDVAREAASLVLLDDNFASIVSAIRLGRKIFDNLQKAMSYIMAIHMPIIGLALLPAFFPALPLLLMPLHIIFMELIIDPVCSVAFESEQEELNIMKRAPRNSQEAFFGAGKILHSVVQGGLLLVMVLAVYFLSVREGHTEGEIRAITFSALIIGNIFLILTKLSKTRCAFASLAEKNVPLLVILVVATSLLLLILLVPFLQSVFSFEFPGFQHFITSLSGAAILLLLLEAGKYFRNRKGV